MRSFGPRARLGAVALLCCLGTASVQAEPSPADSKRRDEQLAMLDSEAGLVFSLQLPQLQAVHALASEIIPEERQAINLAGLGAGAILGFYPFDAKAWTTSGFDIKTPLMAQVAAADPGTRVLRTRVVLRARNVDKARGTIQRMRVRDKARPQVARESLLPLLADVQKTPDEDQVRKRLSEAGVFLVGRPLPLSGLLFAQARGNFIVIDLLDPKGQDFDWLMDTLGRTPRTLSGSSRGADVLVEGPIGLWIRATQLGATLRQLTASDAERSKGCRVMAELGKASSVAAVGIRVDLEPKSVGLDATWHLQPGSDVLDAFTTGEHPLLGGHGLIDAVIRVSSWNPLRDRPRPAQAQSWDAVWAHSSTCGHGSQAYALGVAWPELLGLFLSELSILHPSGAKAIESLGAITAQIGVGPENRLTFFTESWMAAEGANIAKGWLRSLFGSERVGDGKHRWGDGSIRPYALDLPGGSVIGAGYRPGSRQFALSDSRRKIIGEAPAVGEAPAAGEANVLAQLRANPSALATRLASWPRPKLWQPWRSLTALLEKGEQKLKLTISLRRGDDR